MADTSTVTISGIAMSDGTRVTFPALEYITLSNDPDKPNKKNLIIKSPVIGTNYNKINIEPDDNLQIKPGTVSEKGSKVQLQTENYPTNKKDEFKIAVTDGEKTHYEGLQMEVAGLKFISCSADTTYWSTGEFPMYFKQESGDTDSWSQVKMHGSSFDVRTRTTGPGTGGGIALQQSSCDSDGNENKFKIETDRKKDVFAGLVTKSSESTITNWSDYYTGTGGQGIEIGTVNSQFDSFYTSEIRRAATSRVFAATRRGPAEHWEWTESITVSTVGDGTTEHPSSILSNVKDLYKIDNDWYSGKKCQPWNKLTDASKSAIPATKKLDKVDYITQKDDSKDIKNTNPSSLKIVWADIINAAVYLKAKQFIPSSGQTSGTFNPADTTFTDKAKYVYYTDTVA